MQLYPFSAGRGEYFQLTGQGGEIVKKFRKYLPLIPAVLIVILALALAFCQKPERDGMPRGGTSPIMEREQKGTVRTVRDEADMTSLAATEVDASCHNSSSDESSDGEGDGVSADDGRREADAFDAVVDRWTDPHPGGVSMKDVDEFRKAFCQVPDGMKDECLHRALNLIPDENVMLLAGILLDKSQDRDRLVTIFNDMLNRSDQAKLPILQHLCTDKDHPCREDAVWILDATDDEKPQAK